MITQVGSDEYDSYTKEMGVPAAFCYQSYMTAAEIHDDVDVANRNGAWGGATFTAAAQHRMW